MLLLMFIKLKEVFRHVSDISRMSNKLRASKEFVMCLLDGAVFIILSLLTYNIVKPFIIILTKQSVIFFLRNKFLHSTFFSRHYESVLIDLGF